MKRQELEAKFKEMYQEADQDARQAMFEDCVNNMSTEMIKTLVGIYFTGEKVRS